MVVHLQKQEQSLIHFVGFKKFERKIHFALHTSISYLLTTSKCTM
jgi:hypothetical protein